jgi:hypothetical protein
MALGNESRAGAPSQRANATRRRQSSSTVSRFAPPKEAKSEATNSGKQITGRKRHLVVDTLGLVLAVAVHGTYWQD